MCKMGPELVICRYKKTYCNIVGNFCYFLLYLAFGCNFRNLCHLCSHRDYDALYGEKYPEMLFTILICPFQAENVQLCLHLSHLV